MSVWALEVVRSHLTGDCFAYFALILLFFSHPKWFMYMRDRNVIECVDSICQFGETGKGEKATCHRYRRFSSFLHWVRHKNVVPNCTSEQPRRTRNSLEAFLGILMRRKKLLLTSSSLSADSGMIWKRCESSVRRRLLVVQSGGVYVHLSMYHKGVE